MLCLIISIDIPITETYLSYHANTTKVRPGPYSRLGAGKNGFKSHDMVQVSCSWGYTTTGGAKGVGESTTSAVVISLVLIFVFDFGLSFLFFQGQGDALASLA